MIELKKGLRLNPQFVKRVRLLPVAVRETFISQLLRNGVYHTFDSRGKHLKTCLYEEINMEDNRLQIINGRQ